MSKEVSLVQALPQERLMFVSCCRAILLVVLGTLFAGCQSVPLRPNTGPITAFHSNLQFGTPLSGPRKSANPLTRSPDYIIQAHFWTLYYLPHVALPALAGQSTLMINNSAGRPTMAFPALSSGAQFGIVKNTAAFATILHRPDVRAMPSGSASAALWPGLSVAMRLTDSHALSSNGKALRQLLALWIWQPQPIASIASTAAASPKKIGIAFEFKRLNTAASPPALLRQLQVLPTRQVPIATTYAAVLPFRFLNGETQAVAIMVTIRPWKNTPMNQRLATAGRREILAPLHVHKPRQRLNRPDLTVALDNLGKYGVRRSSLVYLAGQTGADLTQDVAAVAKTPVLGALVRAVAAKTLHAQAMTPTELGWVLDKTTYGLLYTIQKTKPLPEQLRIALALHLGEAAWHASSLDEMDRALASRADYRLRIIKENLIYLEDSSPADRLTAYDWLKSRHLAPPNYNPLAGNQARNTALDQAENNAAYLRRIQP